ncbi:MULTISPECIES: DUF979 domain-containing protein [unclassified Lactobacillus]|uniref:DUF979 domain-containing protein n=1 Tax=unclassified Lactobacillus TaxID=2620435 RepID=UPI000EFB0AD2|nr:MULTISPECIES: DUF979 domain-containing protein [unclassified Lactobacillus]RMC23932.1 DUF979 domain-containing protein [Lactobacillus sp. ESL0247]RMC28303.1 DUF979 domain-containing protein [Lactobacillus sp. ESL0246]RMC31029.1 DUF979 domain-containing protein [Lactobacillus sp. ESL0245]RMC47791.1 DUF979 domain-containing protein [Lactobacillus sp. ESL0228]
MVTLINNLLLAFYILIGLFFLAAAIESWRDQTNQVRWGTGLFWFLFAVLFCLGQWLPSEVSGGLIIFIALLSLFKQVRVGHIKELNEKVAADTVKRIGNWIFLPSILLAILALAIAQYTNLGGQVGIGIAAIVSLIVAMILTKSDVKTAYEDSQRMVRSVGSAGILPQLLATLGVVFTASGVGETTAKAISGLFPIGNHLLGVCLYCVAMAIFTAIMGNAFAAFAVITAGIGIPFVVAQGGSPVVVAALGMTSGYCGTLVTPMAANFNTLPVALMEMKDQLGVIKQQLPIAISMLIIQIILMYFLAF